VPLQAGLIENIVKMTSKLVEAAEAGKKIDEALLGTCLDSLLIISTQPAGQKGLVKAEASTVIVAGTKTALVKSNAALSRSHVAILGNLATEASQSKAMLKAQGAIAVVDVMKMHPDNPQVQEAATGAIRNMCVDETGRLNAANADAINTIIEAMRTHAEIPRVVQNGISALINLSQSSNKNKAAMRRAGVIPLVKASIASHPSAKHLVEVGMFFLQELGVKSI